jgi:hypothetical protein
MQLRALRGWILAVSWTLAVSTAAPRAAEAAGPADPMPEVLISGERPGPGMWHVSSGNHTLWILATLVPLPRQMTWRSHEVGTRIASSRVVPAPPEIMADVGVFGDPIYQRILSRAEKIRITGDPETGFSARPPQSLAHSESAVHEQIV